MDKFFVLGRIKKKEKKINMVVGNVCYLVFLMLLSVVNVLSYCK